MNMKEFPIDIFENTNTVSPITSGTHIKVSRRFSMKFQKYYFFNFKYEFNYISV